MRIFFLLLPALLFSVTYEKIELPGPVIVHALFVDPEKAIIRPSLGMDQGVGIEPLSSIAKRKGAIAGVNASFFEMGKPYEGIASCLLKIDGKWVFSPKKTRGAIGFSKDGKTVLIDRLALHTEIEIDGCLFPIDAINRPRKNTEIVLYTSLLHPTTLTKDGIEILFKDEHFLGLQHGGNAPIPENGFVLSIGSFSRMLPHPHKRIALHHSITSTLHPENASRFEELPFIIGGIPVLIDKGEIPDFTEERVIQSFITKRHPRTALGIKEDGTWLFVVVDGRINNSLGMTLHELAEFLLDEDCTYALNLDGGGSAGLFYDGSLRNTPPGKHEYDLFGKEGKELPIGDAILIWEKATEEDAA